MTKEIRSAAELMEMANAFRVSRIILTAHELGIFTLLNNESLSSADMAEKIKSEPRATDRLMNALVATGLLEKSGNRFRNTDFSAKYLVEGSPAFLGGLSHMVSLWRTWSTLTEAVKTGHTVSINESISDRGESWLKSFIAAMHSRGVRQAIEVADVLDFRNVKKILDVGGGSGAFSFEFLKRCEDAVAVVFDLPEVVPITQEYIAAAGMESRVRIKAGDYLTSDLGKDFNLVYISAVIHINDPAENMLLIRKAVDALAPGGQLVIMDHVMNESRTEPAMGAIFALNMLVGTKHGDTYTENEIRSWMESAGLTRIKRIDTPEGTNLMVGLIR